MQVAAIMMVRNEAAIIADSVGHLLLNVGVNRVYVVDNGSTDQTYALLSAMAARDRRLMIRSVPGPFHQPKILRWMTEKAVEDGADWLLPNDADEFLWPATALRALCTPARGDGIAGYSLNLRNFVQLDWIAHDRPGTLETMVFAATPTGRPYEGPALVGAGLPFVRARYLPKLLLRASPTIHLHRGSHSATGVAGQIVPAPVGELLHAPIRSRGDLASRVEHGQRVADLVDDPGTSWHLRRLIGMDADALQAEWRANSTSLRLPPSDGLKIDLRLRYIARGLRQHRIQVWGDMTGRVADVQNAFARWPTADVHPDHQICRPPLPRDAALGRQPDIIGP